MTAKVDQYPSIYPSLDNNSQFRLTEISKLKAKLQDEVTDRKQLCKIYNRAENILDGIDITTNSVALALSVSSGVLASTGILLPFAIPLVSSAGTLGVVGITCKFINKKLKTKSKKHYLITQTAESKLNSILEIVDKAINDNVVSEEEFKLVVDEMNKYNELKKNIQTKQVASYANTISEDQKNRYNPASKKGFYKSIEINFKCNIGSTPTRERVIPTAPPCYF